MSDKPPFDPVRASFYLLTAILTFQCVVAFTGLMFCVWYAESIIEGKLSCANIGNNLNQLLTGALAAALAFTAGFTKRDK